VDPDDILALFVLFVCIGMIVVVVFWFIDLIP
jgi:hypothetical protein